MYDEDTIDYDDIDSFSRPADSDDVGAMNRHITVQYPFLYSSTAQHYVRAIKLFLRFVFYETISLQYNTSQTRRNGP